METSGLSKKRVPPERATTAGSTALPPGQARGAAAGSALTRAALPASPRGAGGVSQLTATNALPSRSRALGQELHHVPVALSQGQGLTMGSGPWDASVPPCYRRLCRKLFNSSSNRGVVIPVTKTLLCSTSAEI